MATALLALLFINAPLELVTVPTSTEAVACQVLEAAAEVVERDEAVWVERRSGDFSWIEADRGGVLRWQKKEAKIRAEHALLDTVAAVSKWRGLQVDPWTVAPSEAAWRAACEGRAEVYDLAGSALTPAMLRTPMPPPAKASSALERFVDGALSMKSGRARASLLEDWREALAEGATLPRWVTAELHAEAEVSGVLPDGRALFHEDGRFYAVDPTTGTTSALNGGDEPTEPEVLLTPYGPLFLSADGLRWDAATVKLDHPFPEVVVGSQRLYAATSDQVIAFELSSGAEIWSHPLEERAVAGPVEAGRLIIVPLEDAVLALGPSDGRPRWQVALGDDLAAPLIAGQDVVWALVGARTVIGVDVPTGRWGFQSDALPPLRDTLAFGGRLFAIAGGGELWSMEIRGQAERLDEEAAGPLLRRTGLGGFVHRRDGALVARSPVGAELWEADVEGRIATTVDGLGVVLGEADARWLDLRQGSVAATIPLATPPRDGVASHGGAIVLDRSGRMIGLPRPDDARRRRLEVFAGRLLGEAHRQSGARSSALKEAERILARAPRDLGARLLRARSERRPGLAEWLPVSALAPEGSAARAEALQALAELGVQAVVPLPSTPKRIERVGPDVVQIGASRWTEGRLERGGEMPPPSIARTPDAAPSPVQIGDWKSTELYGRRLLNGDVALATAEGAWWLLHPESTPSRLVRNGEALALPMGDGFVIVDDRKVYGVDGPRRRLLGPLSLSAAPLRVEVMGETIVAQTAPGLLEQVEPLRLRRGERWAFGQPLAAWTTTSTRIIAVTEDAQLAALAAD